MLEVLNTELSALKDVSAKNAAMLQTNQVNAMQTHVPFKLADMSGLIDDKMVSTYRGGDNMKLKIIDQSVLQ